MALCIWYFFKQKCFKGNFNLLASLFNRSFLLISYWWKILVYYYLLKKCIKSCFFFIILKIYLLLSALYRKSSKEMKYRYVKRNYNYYINSKIFQKVSNILSLSLGFIFFSNQIFMPNTLNLDSKLMELVEYSKSIANIVWVSSQNCREYFGQLQIFPPICQIFHDDCVGKQYEVEYNLHKIWYLHRLDIFQLKVWLLQYFLV